jgi:hypothetical protein
MQRTVGAVEAVKLPRSIAPDSCIQAIGGNRKADRAGQLSAQSLLSLFCWAKTGMTGEEAHKASVRAFDRILPIAFTRAEAVLDRGQARTARYASGNVEEEFERMVEGIGKKGL